MGAMAGFLPWIRHWGSRDVARKMVFISGGLTLTFGVFLCLLGFYNKNRFIPGSRDVYQKKTVFIPGGLTLTLGVFVCLFRLLKQEPIHSVVNPTPINTPVGKDMIRSDGYHKISNER